MSTPVWAQDLYRQHHMYVDKHMCHEVLSPEETLQRERVYSLIEAYEAWDCNEADMLLRLRLLYADMQRDIAEGYAMIDDAERFLAALGLERGLQARLSSAEFVNY